MNKTEMAKKLAKKTDLTQAKAAEVIDAIFSSDSGKGIIAVELDAARPGPAHAVIGVGEASLDYRPRSRNAELLAAEFVSQLEALVLVAGGLYLVIFGRHLLVERIKAESLTEGFHLNRYLSEVVVLPGSPLIGQSIIAARLGEQTTEAHAVSNQQPSCARRLNTGV